MDQQDKAPQDRKAAQNIGNRPAFPVVLPGQHGAKHTCYSGISVRDYFAATALPSVIASGLLQLKEPSQFGHDMAATFAGAAYELADAMLAARAK